MLKPYSELVKIDVTPHCKTRDKNLYLPWGVFKRLLHENGAEKVYFEPLTNANGSTLFMSDKEFTDKDGITNRCYEVRIKTVIDDLEYVTNYPLMNGSNPVRDNSLNQLRVNNAQARAFVKGVAIHTGLGFSLWDEDGLDDLEEDLSKHQIYKIKQRIEEKITALIKRGMSEDDIVSSLNINKKQLSTILDWFQKISSFEAKLNKL
jgi:hypothetical protein